MKTANAQFEAGDLRSAVNSYRRAYRMSAEPELLYRMGLVYAELQNFELARTHFQLYLQAEPDAPYADRIAARIEQLKARTSDQAYLDIASTPDGALVFVDGDWDQPVGRTPVVIPVGPGDHLIRLQRADHRTVDETVRADPGQTLSIGYDLDPLRTSVQVQAELDIETDLAPKAKSEPKEVDVQKWTIVDAGPPPWASVAAWSGVILGYWMIILAVAPALPQDSGLLGGVGAGLLLGGGYLLWFHDWRPELPDQELAPSPPVVGAGYQWAF